MPAVNERAAAVFAALGEPARLRLVHRISAGRRLSITELSCGMEMTRQAVTKHLRVLEGAGVARCTRHGRRQLWALRPESLDGARRHLEVIGRQWESALDRLKRKLEAEERG